MGLELMSNWSTHTAGVDISDMIVDSFPFDPSMSVQGGVRDLSQSNLSLLPPSPSSFAMPPQLEDAQSRPTEDPDTLREHKQMVLSKLLESTNLDEVWSRIRDLVSTSGDVRYKEVLASAQQQRPDIAESGATAALKRRGNKKKRLPFACILCDDALTTNSNLMGGLTYFDAAAHIYLPANNVYKDHYRSHLKWDAFLCRHCGASFRTAATLKRHLKKATRCLQSQEPVNQTGRQNFSSLKSENLRSENESE